jgi:hypothetical protein
LLEDEIIAQQLMAVLEQQWQQLICVIGSIDLCFLWHKVQPSFPVVADASRHHYTARELGALPDESTCTDIALPATRPHLAAAHWRVQVKYFFISKKYSLCCSNCAVAQQLLAADKSLLLRGRIENLSWNSFED